MGKTGTRRPLRILVHPDIADWPEWEELRAEGHTVGDVMAGDLTTCDLVMGPTCWRMDKHMRKYLNSAVGAVQRIKYPPKKGEPGVSPEAGG